MSIKNISLLSSVCMLPLFCSASDTVISEYSISSMYTGTIGKNNVTMNLVMSNEMVSGSYVYDKYKKKIFLNGVSGFDYLELKERRNDSTAVMKLVQVDKGYTGEWCDKKCFPVMLKTHNSFRNGELKDIKVNGSELGSYQINLFFKSKNETITITDAIESPFFEFVDINGDGFYDLIAITDHRPNNGSQTVYISNDNAFVKDDILSKENGTLVYDPYKKNIIFNAKDDCCYKFNKVIYYFNNGKAVKVDSISFNYSSNKGKDSKGQNISKDKFESY